MSRFRTLSPVLVAGLLAVAVGCGQAESAKPVAAVVNPPPAVAPEPVKPPPDFLPPIVIPSIPLPPVDPPPPPMPRPAPLPPDEPLGPGPAVAVVPPKPPMPNPNPMPNPPGGAEPPVANPLNPPKKAEYPKLIAGRSLEEWLEEAIRHKDPQFREAALRILPLFGPGARALIIRPLCAVIRNSSTDPSIRLAAIGIVANLGFDFRINDNTSTPAEKKKMAELRAASREVIGALMAVMADTGPGSSLRLACVQALATFGADAHIAVGVRGGNPGNLRQMAVDPSWPTRQATAVTLGVVGVPPEKDGKTDWTLNPYDPATDILLNVLLKDKCAAVRVTATQSLLMLGPPKVKTGEDYVKAVQKYLKPVVERVEPLTPGGKPAEEDHAVLVWQWLLQLSYDSRKLDENIKKIAHQVKEPTDTGGAGKDKGAGVRLQALYCLAALGPRAAPAMPTLREALDQYDDPVIVVATLQAIASVGTKGGADALPELTKVKNGSKDGQKPDDAPKDWKPNPFLRLLAEDAINVVTGKVKMNDLKEEPKK